MTPARNGRSHTSTVVLVLVGAALIVVSASAAVLWSAYRSNDRRVAPGRRPEKSRVTDTSNRPNPRGRGLVAAAVDCGAIRHWDSDGDGISDSVEQNNRTFHAFDPAACDRDPSAATGKPASGTLVRGVNLTDRGTGYIHLRGTDPPETDDWATLRMLTCIEAVGREAEALELRITINDLSLRPGGHFVPHSSHQNGLDVDVRYVRRDGRQAPLDIRQSPADYDALTTQALLRTFLQRCEVSTIFADLPSLNFTNEELDRPVLVQAPGHTNHFHVRLRPPS